MNAASPGSQREFLLKQIENEIDAGFTLVAAARRAYASRQPGEGDDALANALGAHQEALKHMSDSELGQMRAIVHQLEELRGAIDWLSESHLERTKSRK